MGTSYPERIVAEVFAGLPAGTATAVGRRETGVHAAPPRVVAIPLGASSIDMTDKPGAQKFVDPDTGLQVESRFLLIRRFRVQWEVHATAPSGEEDFGYTERLFVATLQAIRKACHHSVVFSDEEWIDQLEGRDAWIKDGNVIRFVSTIDIPVWEKPGYTRVYLTATPPIETTATLNDEQEGE